MASPKTELFTQDEVQLAALAKALAHPARIAILKVLAEQKTCICGTIVDALPLSQATVSQHLRELKAAGLIQGEVDGPRICYCINNDMLISASGMLSGFMSNCCGPECAC